MILFLSCLTALILLIWFKTDALVEYCELFGIKNQEYKDKKLTETFPLSYPCYLRMKYNNFFINLISCPICLGVWLSAIQCLVVFQFLIFPVVCVCSLIIYGVVIKLLGL